MSKIIVIIDDPLAPQDVSPEALRAWYEETFPAVFAGAERLKKSPAEPTVSKPQATPKAHKDGNRTRDLPLESLLLAQPLNSLRRFAFTALPQHG